MKLRRVVLDTSVLFAGLRSRRGASFRLISLLEAGRYEIALSVPLLFEYEDVLSRLSDAGAFRTGEIGDFLDYVCTVAHHQEIFFLWRPLLSDPKDDLVLELAVAAGCEGIVTHNERHFAEVGRFGIRVYTPKEFLRLLKEMR